MPAPVGGGLGAVAAPFHVTPSAPASLLGTGVPLLAGVAVPSIAVLAVLFALCGVFGGPTFGATLVVRQDRAPEHLRSQVFTLGAGAKLAANAAGAVLGGLLAVAPTAGLLTLTGAFPVLASAAGTVALRRLRPTPSGLGSAETKGPPDPLDHPSAVP